MRGLGLVGVACVLLAIWRVADPSLGSAAQVLPPERQGLIVFVARSGLYVIDAKGGPAKKIPGTRLGDSDPVWSPDGSESPS